MFEYSEAYAKQQDELDVLRGFRQKFYFPETPGEHCIYFTGNSLGLQPKSAAEALEQELQDWAKLGVEGHFHARNPWYSYHELLQPEAARIVGANPTEVVHMNSLTTNLHLLMVSFYRPSGKKYKILCEQKAFPSDQYALASQVKFHGYDPADAIIEVKPEPGSHTISTNQVLSLIQQHQDELALVFIGGVNYYTGQVFDMQKIAAEAHKYAVPVGFDLAHAAGNIPLQLHDWGVDFAAWCTYKYLNSGPGSVSGVFIHEKHGNDDRLPRFAGWWGSDKRNRFEMRPEFVPIKGAEGWQLSNAPVFSMAPHLASLKLFAEAGMDRLREKSIRLTGYLHFVMKEVAANTGVDLEVITPEAEMERGCQLSILAHGFGKKLFDGISAQGVVADWREPNVIRVAPVPLYNSFADVFHFGRILESVIKQLS